jgi:hypothetical protein
MANTKIPTTAGNRNQSLLLTSRVINPGSEPGTAACKYSSDALPLYQRAVSNYLNI